jgi:hypothetical protein
MLLFLVFILGVVLMMFLGVFRWLFTPQGDFGQLIIWSLVLLLCLALGRGHGAELVDLWDQDRGPMVLPAPCPQADWPGFPGKLVCWYQGTNLKIRSPYKWPPRHFQRGGK